MPSKKRVEPLQELATTLALAAEDHQRLWNVRELDWLPPAEYLEWCSFQTRDQVPSRDDITSDDDEPFRL